jgi:serine/threonine protein kinase
VDWYALGVLVYEMLAGVPPYHQPEQPANPIRLYEDIMRGPGALKMAGFAPAAGDLILKLMEGEPSKRFGNLKHGSGDVFTHAWFREVDWAKLLDRQITAPYLPKIQGEGDASACVLWVCTRSTRADYNNPQVRKVPRGCGGSGTIRLVSWTQTGLSIVSYPLGESPRVAPSRPRSAGVGGMLILALMLLSLVSLSSSYLVCISSHRVHCILPSYLLPNPRSS